MARDMIDAVAVRELVRALTAPPVGGAPVVVPPAVLRTLGELVPADFVAFNDMAPRRRSDWAWSDTLSGEAGGCGDGPPPYGEEDDPFFAAYWSAPCSYPDRSGDSESVTTISDFCSLREWRSSRMYDVLRSDIPFDRELMLPLPAPAGHSRRIRFLRTSGADFDDTDRSLALLVRPHVVGYLQARDLVARGVLPLTVRQRQLVSLLDGGHSNAQIARSLGISSQTVRTHLQQIYARLGVTSRGEAVALVRAPVAATPLLQDGTARRVGGAVAGS